MIVTNQKDYNTIKDATKISTEILRQAGEMITEGITPYDIETYITSLLKKYHVKSSFKGVPSATGSYQYNSCIAVNDEILHSIPKKDIYLTKGDIVKVDLGIIYKGVYTDQCFTFGVSHLSIDDIKLVSVAKNSVEQAIQKALPKNKANVIGSTMYSIAQQAGFYTLSQYAGHGIGRSLHEDPEIIISPISKGGQKLKEGMVICVECQVVSHSDQIYVDTDGWTIKSEDGSKGAMFEYMVIVRKQSPEVLTDMFDWNIVV